jgi:hypothetical protein
LDRPGLQFAIESSADEVWPLACNSPSQGGNFEGMRLLLGVAYVQPKTGMRRGEGRVENEFSTRLGGLTEWRMYSRLRVDGTRFEEATCVALCSLSGKQRC